MINELDHDRLIELSYSKFKEAYLVPKNAKKTLNLNLVIAQIKQIEPLLINNKRFIGLFSHTSFTPVYASNNLVKKIGFTRENFYNSDVLNFMKLLHQKHIFSPYRICSWITKFMERNEQLSIEDNVLSICGIKIRDKDGLVKTGFLKVRNFKNALNQNTALSFFEIEDISNIYKGDFYWLRITNKDSYRNYTKCYISNGTKKEYLDLFTPRELEVLTLSKEQKSLEEIATTLNLSKETVKRHRKNMLARSGLKDIPSLIHICYLCDIF